MMAFSSLAPLEGPALVAGQGGTVLAFAGFQMDLSAKWQGSGSMATQGIG